MNDGDVMVLYPEEGIVSMTSMSITDLVKMIEGEVTYRSSIASNGGNDSV